MNKMKIGLVASAIIATMAILIGCATPEETEPTRSGEELLAPEEIETVDADKTLLMGEEEEIYVAEGEVAVIYCEYFNNGGWENENPRIYYYDDTESGWNKPGKLFLILEWEFEILPTLQEDSSHYDCETYTPTTFLDLGSFDFVKGTSGKYYIKKFTIPEEASSIEGLNFAVVPQRHDFPYHPVEMFVNGFVSRFSERPLTNGWEMGEETEAKFNVTKRGEGDLILLTRSRAGRMELNDNVQFDDSPLTRE